MRELGVDPDAPDPLADPRARGGARRSSGCAGLALAPAGLARVPPAPQLCTGWGSGQLHDTEPVTLTTVVRPTRTLPVAHGGQRRVAVQPEKRLLAFEKPAVALEAAVVRVVGTSPAPSGGTWLMTISGYGRPSRRVASDRTWLHASRSLRLASFPRLPGQVRPAMASPARRITAGRHDRIGAEMAARPPAVLGVVVPVDVDQRRVDRVRDERQVVAVQVAASDDQVDDAEGRPVALVEHHRIHAVRHAEKPDRRAVAISERRGIGPLDRQDAGSSQSHASELDASTATGSSRSPGSSPVG